MQKKRRKGLSHPDGEGEEKLVDEVSPDLGLRGDRDVPPFLCASQEILSGFVLQKLRFVPLLQDNSGKVMRGAEVASVLCPLSGPIPLPRST